MIQTILGRHQISTIKRKSSAVTHSEVEYYETCVFYRNQGFLDTLQDEMLEQEDSGMYEDLALENHFLMVKKYYKILTDKPNF